MRTFEESAEQTLAFIRERLVAGDSPLELTQDIVTARMLRASFEQAPTLHALAARQDGSVVAWLEPENAFFLACLVELGWTHPALSLDGS